VRLFTAEEGLFKFLKSNLDFLISIFIVSDVSLERVPSDFSQVSESADIPQLGIEVEKIGFSKCQRCWNYRPSVGKNNEHPRLCQRCVEVIEELEKTEKPDTRVQ
jgi:isoleucyl-tRNA synthetase